MCTRNKCKIMLSSSWLKRKATYYLWLRSLKSLAALGFRFCVSFFRLCVRERRFLADILYSHKCMMITLPFVHSKPTNFSIVFNSASHSEATSKPKTRQQSHQISEPREGLKFQYHIRSGGKTFRSNGVIYEEMHFINHSIRYQSDFIMNFFESQSEIAFIHVDSLIALDHSLDGGCDCRS